MLALIVYICFLLSLLIWTLIFGYLNVHNQIMYKNSFNFNTDLKFPSLLKKNMGV